MSATSLSSIAGRGTRRASNDGFPELDDFYRNGRRTPFSLFIRYLRYGMEKKEICERIQRERPDVVGISSSFAAYSRQAAEAAAVAKEVDRFIVTVMDGTHPTLFPRCVLEDGDVDYVVRGEGETPLRELVHGLSSGTGPRSKISGLSVRRNVVHHVGGINTEDDIDTIPA